MQLLNAYVRILHVCIIMIHACVEIDITAKMKLNSRDEGYGPIYLQRTANHKLDILQITT